jgi:hypothetical protein
VAGEQGVTSSSEKAKANAFSNFSSAASPFAAARQSSYQTAASTDESAGVDRKGKRSFDDILRSGNVGEGPNSQVESDENGRRKQQFTPQAGMCFHDSILHVQFIDDKPTAVLTGEEDEQVLHAVKAKLFVLEGDSWKERGIGNLKLLSQLPEKGDRVTRLGV